MKSNKIPSWTCLAVCLLLAGGCSEVATPTTSDINYDRTTNSRIETESDYPVVLDVAKVGSYPMLTKSGGGYFYDDVLEYRVWIDSQDGDHYKAFASFEDAQEFSDTTPGAEEPLVLVFQKEHVNEPVAGTFEHVKTERISEWRVEWLDGNKRTEKSIPEFLLENDG